MDCRTDPSPTPHVPQIEGSHIGDHILSTSCGVVERPDHHCGNDLVINSIWSMVSRSRHTVPATGNFIDLYKVSTTMMIGPHDDCTKVVLDLRLIIWLAKNLSWSIGLRWFMASPHNQPMCFQTCCIVIFVDLQAFGCNFKGGLFDPPLFRGL